MTIKLFGLLAAFIAPEIQLELPEEITKQTILARLSEEFPNQKNELNKCNVAVNQVYIFEESINLKAVNEIAIIPPVSGG